jgi:hypothetical protein
MCSVDICQKCCLFYFCYLKGCVTYRRMAVNYVAGRNSNILLKERRYQSQIIFCSPTAELRRAGKAR